MREFFSSDSMAKSLFLTSLIGSDVQAEGCLFWNTLQMCFWGQLLFGKRGREGIAPSHHNPQSLPTAYRSLGVCILQFCQENHSQRWGRALCPHWLTWFSLPVCTTESKGPKLQLKTSLPWCQRPQKPHWQRNWYPMWPELLMSQIYKTSFCGAKTHAAVQLCVWEVHCGHVITIGNCLVIHHFANERHFCSPVVVSKWDDRWFTRWW